VKGNQEKPKILYICSEDWYFRNHRLDHAKALIASGFEVHVATRVGGDAIEIQSAGCITHSLDLGRGLGNPLHLALEIVRLQRTIRSVRPAIVHALTLRISGLAAPLVKFNFRTRFVMAINGLGISTVEQGKLLKVFGFLLRFISNSKRVIVLFQNTYDPASLKMKPLSYSIIPGVGVNLERFVSRELPPAPPWQFVFLGRTVRSKGLMDLVAVAKRPEIRAAQIEFVLYCTTDLSSPGSLTEAEIHTLSTTKGITVLPHTNEPQVALAKSHAAILTSYGGEGVSKFLMESMAVGRPVIATDTPGSDVLIDPGITGWLYTPGDVDQLVSRLLNATSIGREALNSVGSAARTRIETKFDVQIISKQIVDLHREILSR
jgi:glycosyltransferase involved in cell wall biosynthesis